LDDIPIPEMHLKERKVSGEEASQRAISEDVLVFVVVFLASVTSQEGVTC